MRTSRRSPVLVGAILGILLMHTTMSPAWGHAGGRVEIHLLDLTVDSAGPGSWRLRARLVDRDSGTPATALEVTADGSGPAGRFGPIPLFDENGSGEYVGEVDGGAGSWLVTINADSLPGAAVAIPLTETVTLEFGAGAPVRPSGDARRSEPDAATAEGSRYELNLATADEVGQNPNWVSVQAEVTDIATGEGAYEGLEVFVGATSPQGDKVEALPLVVQRQKGLFKGFVILPYGGQWVLTATLVEKIREEDRGDITPTLYARDNLRVDVEGIVLESTVPGSPLERLLTEEREGTGSRPFDAAVLWIHTLVALGWIAVVAFLALLGLPSGRRFLSDQGVTRLDARLGLAVHAVGWLTGLVLVTGVYNILKSTPYVFPLTPSEARGVFDLPYGQGYFLALWAKLASYALMMGAAVPIASQARKASRVWLAITRPTALDNPRLPASSPWEFEPEPASVGVAPVSPVKRPGSLTLNRGMETSVEGPSETDSGQHVAFKTRRVPLIVFAGGALVMTLAVTLLKYFHLMSEVVR